MFQSFWVEHCEYGDVVKGCWQENMGCSGNSVDVLVGKLKKCRKRLIAWSKEVFPNNNVMLSQLSSELQACLSGDFF